MPVDKYCELTTSNVVYAERSLETGKSFTSPYRLTDDIDLEVVSYPIIDEKGKIVGAIGSGFDNEVVKKLNSIVNDVKKKRKRKQGNDLSYGKKRRRRLCYADKKMKRVFDSAGLIAATDSTVLINGERRNR